MVLVPALPSPLKVGATRRQKTQMDSRYPCTSLVVLIGLIMNLSGIILLLLMERAVCIYIFDSIRLIK